jgi:hypothetical protein
MKYALLIYDVGEGLDGLPDEERDAARREYFALREAPGVFDGARLAPVHAATTVRVRGEETLTTDGPFADTKEFFGGYYLLEADDLDAAIDVARRIPAARMGGAVEVRPILG